MDGAKRKKKRWPIIVIILVVIVIIAVAAGSGDEPNNDIAGTPSTSTPTTKPSEKPQTPATIEYTAELASGNYTAGIDFPAGKYDITAVSGTGNVISSNMFSGGINAMMGIGNPELYELEYQNIKLDEGVVLSVSGGVVISIYCDKASGEPLNKREQPNTETISLGNGNFVAGEDFPAGVYDIVATSGGGNVYSDNMFDGGLNAMMGTSNPDFYESQYKNIELPEGVTLTIDGVKIDLVPSK